MQPHAEQIEKNQDQERNEHTSGDAYMRTDQSVKGRGIFDIFKRRKTEILTGLLGLFATLIFFSAASSHVYSFSKAEKFRLSEELTQRIVTRLNEEEQKFDKIFQRLESQAPEDLKTSQSFEIFSRIVLLSRDNAGSLTQQDLYHNARATKMIFSTDMLDDLMTAHQEADGQNVLAITGDFQTTILQDGIESQRLPIILAKIERAQDNNITALLGEVNFTSLFQNELNWSLKDVADILIRDARTSHNYFTLYRTDLKRADRRESPREFMLNAAGQEWLVQIRFYDSPRYAGLKGLPHMVFGLGIIITAMLMLCAYILSIRKEENEKALAFAKHKNLELDVERAARERTQQAMKAAEFDHINVINAINDVIFETDADGVICFMSQVINDIAGHDPEALKGSNFFELLHSEERERQRGQFDDLLNGHQEHVRNMTRIKADNGTFRTVELAFTLVRKGDTQSRRVVGTLTDVEEYRRTEKALKETEKKYSAIVEHSASGIYQMTPEGIYLSANPAMARLLGYGSPEAMLRGIKNANETVYVDKQERMRFVHKLIKEGAIRNHEVQLQRGDGSIIWVNENVRCVADDDGHILYHEGSLDDITKRKETELEMTEAKRQSDMANRAKTEFLANMSHELRTPLNSIIGFSEMIKNEVFGKIEPRDYWEYAKDIHQSGQGLLNIINEILDISKIEARERELNESLVDISKAVSSCLELMSARYEAKKINIQCELEGIPRLVAEERGIKQILINLMSNAVKFTPDEGRINVSYQVDAHGQLRLSITDTGVGLTDEEIEKALSPFGQIDNELSRSGSGTGLGLTLVDSLMKLHAGKLEMISQKGTGTSVTLVFPVDRVVMDVES